MRAIVKRTGMESRKVANYYDCALPKVRQGCPELRKILGEGE